jgi:hypothetical protein
VKKIKRQPSFSLRQMLENFERGEFEGITEGSYLPCENQKRFHST